ncbi:MFS transporter [Bacillus sp. 31A1R]|uniref:MFS transporter n=1 Tax=Robertmurraya mangrovi TaxID=3098077 RepID=A0ABU5J0E0_9BACI|nr:MFS transporter [Bacillus sp. 31A1R]MDZ5472879.1 MFS transporter [Bacillus sp. 31A1R]
MDVAYQSEPKIDSKRSLWKQRNFLLLWTSGLLWSFGFQFYYVALPLLIYKLSQSASAMSIMRAVEFIPNIMFGMIIGVIVDRYSRKKVMFVTTLVQVLCLCILVILLMAESLHIWHMYLIGFIVSTAGYAFGNAQHSAFPQIFSKEQLTEANSHFSFANTLMSMIGPGIAGMMIVWFSYETNFITYLVILLISLVLVQLTTIPKVLAPPKTKDKSSFLKDMKEGWDELVQNKLLLAPTIIILLLNFISGLGNIIVFYAVDLLQATEKEVGYMLSIGAVGGLVGSLAVPHLKKHFRRGQLFQYSMYIVLAGTIILNFADTWWLVGISQFIRTFAVIVINVNYFSFRQEFTPNYLLGRVAGTSSMLMKLALPFGLFISGIWAEAWNVSSLFICCSILMLLLCLFMRGNPIGTVK